MNTINLVFTSFPFIPHILLGQFFLNILTIFTRVTLWPWKLGQGELEMTSVTLNMGSRSVITKKLCLFIVHRICISNLLSPDQVHLEISSKKFFHQSEMWPWNDRCDLENEVTVTSHEGDLCTTMVHLYTKFGGTSSSIKLKNISPWPWKLSQGHRSRILTVNYRGALAYQIGWG